ncbi:STAS-like domain-containing protein [Thermomonas fusca]
MSSLACVINVARDFSPVPGGRFDEDGEFNGSRFRREYLVPKLQSCESVDVIIDGTEGFGSSFLEEAFGGLVRLEGFKADDLRNRLRIIAEDPRSQRYRRKIYSYMGIQDHAG